MLDLTKYPRPIRKVSWKWCQQFWEVGQRVEGHFCFETVVADAILILAQIRSSEKNLPKFFFLL